MVSPLHTGYHLIFQTNTPSERETVLPQDTVCYHPEQTPSTLTPEHTVPPLGYPLRTVSHLVPSYVR